MEPKYRTGQERFYERYPDYPRVEDIETRGVGAVCDEHLFERLEKEPYTIKPTNLNKI